ncbi:MAG: hypothetical protein B6I25_05625 [Planctomycetales bacterium 4572_13]|nr:MAG: hypothetical protein B6I25_05625 [Planctomycetales bacterium 4572_13]
MQYNRCGDSGLKLPAISLGLWHNFGNVDDFDNARRMIHTAFDNGITHFDLAILESMGVRLLIHQPRYSMLFRNYEKEGLFDTLDELGIGAICYCPLSQGLLTDKYLNGIPDDSRDANPHGFLQKDVITPELVAKLKKLDNLKTLENLNFRPDELSQIDTVLNT